MRKWWIIGASVAVVGLLLCVVLWGVIGDRHAAWWSAWGQWVGGVGSIAAAVAALWIARTGWKRSDVETQRQEARYKVEREDRAKSQARLVNAELMPIPDSTASMRKYVREFAIYNRSDAPVYQAAITHVEGPWDWRHSDGFSEPEPLTPVSVEPASHHVVTATDLLNANVFVQFAPDMLRSKDFAVAVRFMDANGLWWERTGLREPVRVDPDGNPL